MTTFLSGGTGTPKLLWGADEVFDPSKTTVVANTGDDVELGGLFVCPDADTVLFERGGCIDRERWWGIENDTEHVHDALADLSDRLGAGDTPQYLPAARQTEGRDIAHWRRFGAVPPFMTLGDRDRAVHNVRTSLLDQDYSLTEVTNRLATAFGLDVTLLPMSDDPVASIIHTTDGEMHFQEFWVDKRAEPAVESVEFRGADAAAPTDAVRTALKEPVVIGPSNPITSIGPILALDGVREALSETTVVAVSPFVGDRVFSGPAGDLMAAMGYDPSTAGVADAYPFADAFVLDREDETPLDRPVVRTDTEMNTREDATRVARAVQEALEEVR